MLALNPQRVTLAGEVLDHVIAIAVDRDADRLALERSDFGLHLVFADVPEQRVTITITRALLDGAPGFVSDIQPGLEGELSFRTAPNLSDADAQSFEVTVVVIGVKHNLSARRGAEQTITCLAVSADGATNPIAEPR